jgi:hypothetical protein
MCLAFDVAIREDYFAFFNFQYSLTIRDPYSAARWRLLPDRGAI